MHSPGAKWQSRILGHAEQSVGRKAVQYGFRYSRFENFILSLDSRGLVTGLIQLFEDNVHEKSEFTPRVYTPPKAIRPVYVSAWGRGVDMLELQYHFQPPTGNVLTSLLKVVILNMYKEGARDHFIYQAFSFATVLAAHF